ncbi:hypothetical protein DL96DRAFT_116930 [Flagelloscypha sp. PMI_526]|nr:hypothetical protein DL96DRAFT_116930 [Flagelloscypha sp. PMI_526]
MCHISSTARGVDLVLQLGEIGCVLWLWAMPLPLAAWFPGAAVLDSCTVYFLYIPPAFFLVVTKILDAVRFDRGIWLGLQVATRSVPQAKKYRRNRMASTSPRLITVRLYLAFIIVHAASLVGVYIPSLRWETLAQGDGTVTSVFIILASLLVSLVHHLLG